jgi:hypothetical protein
MLTAATRRGGELLCWVLWVTTLLRAADTAGASLPQQVSIDITSRVTFY